MLEQFREFGNKRIVRFIFALFLIIPFGFFGIDYYFRSPVGGDTLATVGPARIGAQEFDNALRQQAETYRQQFKANFDPAISLLQRDNAIKTILDTRHEKDLTYLYGGPFAASAFYADARFIERNPKTTQAFVNAISAALDWLGKASTDEIVAAVPPEYYAGDRDLYRAMIESNRERVSPDGRISAEAAARTFRNLAAVEETMKNAKIDVAKTYDNSFVERAPALRAQ